MRRLLAAVLCALLALPAGAADFGRAGVGTTGSEFLMFDTSARGIALGGAYSAAVNDASALYWNPAGLAQVPRFSGTVMHAQYIADISYNAIAAAGRVNDSSVIGGGIRYLDAGAIKRTDINGLDRGSFKPRSYIAELGWGQSIYDLSDSEMDVSMGVTGKYLHTEMVERASAFAGDLGLHSRFYGTKRNVDVAFVMQNLGRGQKFQEVRDTLPTRLKLGASLRPVKPVLVAGEVFFPINNAPHASAGAEYQADFNKNMKGAVRGGLNTLTYNSLGAVSMVTFGFGLTVQDLTFDYAFVPMGPLGAAAHRLSVSFNLPARVSRRYRER